MKVKIYHDALSETMHTQNVERKKKLFKELVDYCSQFVHLDDLTALSNEGERYFQKVFYARYKDEFPPMVSVQKMIEMVECSLSKISSLHTRYSDIKIEGFNPETCEAPILDFSVYATTKQQVERYKLAQSICDCINQLKAETNYTFFLGQISQGMSGVVQISFDDTTKLIVNKDFVLNEN